MRNEIDKELGNWDKDATIVKHKIYDETINRISTNRFYKWRPFVAIATTLLLVIGTYFMWTLFSGEQMALKEGNENEDVSEINNDGLTNPIVIATSFEPRQFDEISFKIAAYENFYYDREFYSVKEAKKEAAEKLYRWITVINFAEERNIFLNERELNYLKRLNNMKITTLKNHPSEEKYLNNVLATFQITEDQYIEYYVNIENEAFMYEGKLFDLKVDREPLYAKQYDSEIPEEYYEKAGITVAEVKEIDEMWEQIWEQYESKEVTERQFNLPFDLTGSTLNIIQLDNGQYVFENPKYFGFHSTKYEAFIDVINKRSNYMVVNRTSLDDMIDFLLNLNTDYEPYRQLANELAEVYKLLKQSIEWELY
jgi:hypothetical protein